jgi:two-component system, sensor histidine kinase and response regulator
MSEQNQTTNISKETATILVADDDRSVRRLIFRGLSNEPYRLVEVENGEECVNLFRSLQPDLVLMDGKMPVMDGFAACETIRKMADGNNVPILMVTALEDANSVSRAFSAGANDYITKPINWEVLRQRIRRLLESQRAEKLRDDLIHMIIHDMKNPLANIAGYQELLLDGTKGELNFNQREVILRTIRNTNYLLEMANNILDLQKMEEGRMVLDYEKVSIFELFSRAVNSINWMAQSYGVTIEMSCPDNSLITLDAPLILRVLTNLLTNAIKYSVRGSKVFLSAQLLRENDTESWHFKVQDSGEGISLSDQNRIFERYTQASSSLRSVRSGTGLGLTFCKLVAEAHKGKILLESSIGKGSIFTLVLPV